MASTKWGVLPIGSVEAHGPHLPLETDTIIAEELAFRLLKNWPDALPRPRLLPTFVQSACSFAAPFPGTVDVPPERSEGALRQRLDSAKMGEIDRILLINLHFDPVHVRVLRSCAEGHPEVLFVDFTRRAQAQLIGGEFATGSCHAGAFETSLVLAAQADAVDPAFRQLPPVWVDLPAAMKAGKKDFLEAGASDGYCGAPAEASATEGEKLYATLTNILLQTMAANG